MFRPSIIRQRGGHGAEVGREDIFIIHNGQLLRLRPTRRTVLGIATRVLDASSRSAVIGALYRIYATALTEQAGFHWVTIPEGITISGEETFDPVPMRRSTTWATGAPSQGPMGNAPAGTRGRTLP